MSKQQAESKQPGGQDTWALKIFLMDHREKGGEELIGMVWREFGVAPNVPVTSVGGDEGMECEKDYLVHVAAKSGHTKLCQYLFTKYPEQRKMAGNRGYTALHAAAFAGHAETVLAILECDRSLLNEEIKEQGELVGYRALHLAMERRHLPVVETIRKCCLSESEGAWMAQLRAKAGNGFTALHEAFTNKVMGMALLEGPAIGGLLRIPDQDGNYPVHVAAQQGIIELLRMLVAKDPSLITARTTEAPRMSPLSLLAYHDHGDVLLTLMEDPVVREEIWKCGIEEVEWIVEDLWMEEHRDYLLPFLAWVPQGLRNISGAVVTEDIADEFKVLQDSMGDISADLDRLRDLLPRPSVPSSIRDRLPKIIKAIIIGIPEDFKCLRIEKEKTVPASSSVNEEKESKDDVQRKGIWVTDKCTELLAQVMMSQHLEAQGQHRVVEVKEEGEAGEMEVKGTDAGGRGASEREVAIPDGGERKEGAEAKEATRPPRDDSNPVMEDEGLKGRGSRKRLQPGEEVSGQTKGKGYSSGITPGGHKRNKLKHAKDGGRQEGCEEMEREEEGAEGGHAGRIAKGRKIQVVRK